MRDAKYYEVHVDVLIPKLNEPHYYSTLKEKKYNYKVIVWDIQKYKAIKLEQ